MRGDGNSPLVANSPAAALALAGDLARLMDDMTTRQVPWDRLDGLVPADMDEYWQVTLEFLKIAREHWPARARRNKAHRAGRAARPADRGRSQAACDRHRPGDRRGLHRLDAGDRDAARHHREAAAWRGGAARPRHRSRRRDLEHDRRQRRQRSPRTAIRNSPCRRCCSGSASSAMRCESLGAADTARPRTPGVGGAAAGRRDRALAGASGATPISSAMPTPRWTASR